MQELNLNEMVEVSGGGGTCICNSGVIWRSCPSYQACEGWCRGHGLIRSYLGT